MTLIDTHCHVFMPPLATDPAAVLARATAAAVEQVIVPAYDLASWQPVADLGREHGPAVKPALGLHPWVAGEELDAAALEGALRACNAVAIGEIGLDTKVPPGQTDAPADLQHQLEILRTQLDLALTLDLPIILHCRGAFHELRDTIRAANKSTGKQLRGVLHAFSRGPELANEFLDLGLHIGLGGAITRDRATRALKAAKSIPLERILLETDAPSIGLAGVDAQDTEPRHIADICRALAELRGDSPDHIAEETTANARRLFKL